MSTRETPRSVRDSQNKYKILPKNVRLYVYKQDIQQGPFIIVSNLCSYFVNEGGIMKWAKNPQNHVSKFCHNGCTVGKIYAPTF